MVSFMLYRSDTLATPTATMIAQEPATYSLYKNAVVRYTKKRKEIMIFFIITFQGPRTRNQTKQLPMDMEKKKKKKRNEKNEENFVPIFFFFLNFVYRTPVDQAQVQQKLSGTRRKLPLLIPFWFLFSISDLKKREENKKKKTKCFLFSFSSSQRNRSGGTQRQQTGRSVCGKPRRRHRVCGRHHHAPSRPG